MRNLNFTKLFCLIAFLSLSMYVGAQSMTVNELISIVRSDAENFHKAIEAKGYKKEAVVNRGSDVAENVYKNNGYVLIYDVLSFGTKTTMLSWRFNSDQEYQSVLNQIQDLGLKQTDVERRKGGKYLSQYFDQNDLKIIVTKDQAGEYDQTYSVSLMYTPVK